MKRAACHHHALPVLSPNNGRIGCNGKRSYPDKITADKMAERTHRSRSERMQAYRCRVCNAWHVGTNSAHTPMLGRRPRVETDGTEE